MLDNYLNNSKSNFLVLLILAVFIIGLAAAFSFSTRNSSDYQELKNSNGGKSIKISNDKKLVQPPADSSVLGKPSEVQIQSASGANQSPQNPQTEPSGMYPDDQIYPSNPEPCKRAYSERPCIIPPP